MESMPEKNLFMICREVKRTAFSSMPENFTVRTMEKKDMEAWLAMPFDDKATVKEYRSFMVDYFNRVYLQDEEQFYNKTLFVFNEQNQPVATCATWKAYGKFTAIHWFKVVKELEGQGIGRALLTIIMDSLSDSDYPVYLHTQPESFRAIKLYSDFGFQLLTDKRFGTRDNHLEECLPYLQKAMPPQDFHQLILTEAPEDFIEELKDVVTEEF
ncbi:GNAT family N-acetyltransferase [Jeotgalibacillus sp. R-1-5s-1]|uniref:GNAT family N-acetyltransferase n=1 Tax=Jeotgalibacillus sp. R-1-5s-1 TaxID=2555897 RepID=UPI00106C6BDF|nr:GNAT family N-acetyltransferase [Jeotgalibacillus sp. R-1-5s-1]TFD94451.1 N-acetyltransferase [Jeotgalibacillus sp. R-1-5s-1]